MPKSELFGGYIAEMPGHSRGSTVDLTVVRLVDGAELDMGTPFDFFGAESAVDYADLTATQRANRRLLADATRAQGFEPYAEEWWILPQRLKMTNALRTTSSHRLNVQPPRTAGEARVRLQERTWQFRTTSPSCFPCSNGCGSSSSTTQEASASGMQELLDASKAWWRGRRGRLADGRRCPVSVSLGVVPLVFARFVEVPVRIEVAAGP